LRALLLPLPLLGPSSSLHEGSLTPLGEDLPLELGPAPEPGFWRSRSAWRRLNQAMVWEASRGLGA
jgi:hypothetical protein